MLRPQIDEVARAQAASTAASLSGLLGQAPDGRTPRTARSPVERLYRVVLDSLAEEVAIVDRHGQIIDANRAWCAAGGGYRVLEQSLSIGANFLDAIRAAAARHADATAVLGGVAGALAGRALCFHHEYSCMREGGERWFTLRVTALRRAEGGAVVVHYDISRRRRAERVRDLHRAELNRTGGAAALGQLAGALAHELNQPLTAILANAQVGIEAAARGGADEELLAILRDIELDTKRAGQIIKHVRDLLKSRVSEFKATTLNEIVADVLRLGRSDILARDISVTKSLDRSLPLLRGDEVQLQQLLLNLVVNACDAMSAVERGKRELRIATSKRANGWIRLAVSDSGAGFTRVERDKVLQPFYTTKETGLGLGLTICGSIVQAHGGVMKLGRSKSGGARVTIDFPALAPSAQLEPQPGHDCRQST